MLDSEVWMRRWSRHPDCCHWWCLDYSGQVYDFYGQLRLYLRGMSLFHDSRRALVPMLGCL